MRVKCFTLIDFLLGRRVVGRAVAFATTSTSTSYSIFASTTAAGTGTRAATCSTQDEHKLISHYLYAF